MFSICRIFLSVSKRRITDVGRCTKLQFTSDTSDCATSQSTLHWHRYVNHELQKVKENIARHRQTTIRDIDRVLDAARFNHYPLHGNHVLALLKCCGDSLPAELPGRRTEQAQKIWSVMSGMKVQANIHHYNALLEIYLVNEQPFVCKQMMDEIRARRLEPNQRTYELLFEQLCRSEPMDEAMRFIAEIKANGFELTENLYASMMLGYARVGDMARAVAIPNEMKLHGVERTVHTTVSLMKCHARSGDIDAIVDAIDAHAIENSRIKSAQMLAVIVELCAHGHETKIDALVRQVHPLRGYHYLVRGAILQLISRGKVYGAYTLLKTMPRATLASGQLIEIGSFFLKQMIKSGIPTDTIIAMSHRITADGLNSRAMHIALEHALHDGILDVAIALLKELRQLREPIRPHYFWPLLCSEGAKGKEQLFEVIRQMQREFQLAPDAQTVSNYIVPHLHESPSQIIEQLRELDISTAHSVPPIVLHRLREYDLKGACEIAAAHHSIYHRDSNRLRTSLVTALIFSKDFAAFARLIRIIRDSLPLRRESRDENIDDAGPIETVQLDLVGSILFHALRSLRDCTSCDSILRSFIGEELIVSAKYGKRIKKLLSKMDNGRDAMQYIGVLTAHAVEPECVGRTTKILSNVESDLTPRSRRVTKLRDRIDEGEVIHAIRLWKNLKPYELSREPDIILHFVAFLRQNNRHGENQKASHCLLTKIRMKNRAWQDFLYQLASDGNVAALDELKPIDGNLTVAPRDILECAYCIANTLNGTGKEYLNRLADRLNGAKKATDLENFPRNSAIVILSKQPELLDAYKSLVSKYLDKNCTVPLNALWMYYFVTGNDEQCRDLWTNTLSMVPTFSTDCILQVARTNHDAQLIDRLLDFCRSEAVDKAHWIAAYNTLLDIHISNRALEEAKVAVEYTVWDDCYEQLDPNTISNLAEELKAMGQTFPYQIPKDSTHLLKPRTN